MRETDGPGQEVAFTRRRDLILELRRFVDLLDLRPSQEGDSLAIESELAPPIAQSAQSVADADAGRGARPDPGD